MQSIQKFSRQIDEWDIRINKNLTLLLQQQERLRECDEQHGTIHTLLMELDREERTLRDLQRQLRINRSTTLRTSLIDSIHDVYMNVDRLQSRLYRFEESSIEFVEIQSMLNRFTRMIGDCEAATYQFRLEVEELCQTAIYFQRTQKNFTVDNAERVDLYNSGHQLDSFRTGGVRSTSSGCEPSMRWDLIHRPTSSGSYWIIRISAQNAHFGVLFKQIKIQASVNLRQEQECAEADSATPAQEIRLVPSPEVEIEQLAFGQEAVIRDIEIHGPVVNVEQYLISVFASWSAETLAL